MVLMSGAVEILRVCVKGRRFFFDGTQNHWKNIDDLGQQAVLSKKGKRLFFRTASLLVFELADSVTGINLP